MFAFVVFDLVFFQYLAKRLAVKKRLWNDLFGVGWDVKLWLNRCMWS